MRKIHIREALATAAPFFGSAVGLKQKNELRGVVEGFLGPLMSI